MKTSRIPKFYNYTVRERLEILREKGIINADDFKLMINGGGILNSEGADKMIENVIGVFGLPIGLGLYFLINDKDYVIPMAVEEPSVVAAVSSAAKLIRKGGGFKVKIPLSGRGMILWWKTMGKRFEQRRARLQ